MVAKKASKKLSGKKAAVASKLSSKHPLSPAHPLYGRPILDAVRRGDLSEMRRVRTQALAHIKEVNAALAKLDAKIKS
jgi:hypothetical protein